jgi:plasmid replication initiation protein
MKAEDFRVVEPNLFIELSGITKMTKSQLFVWAWLLSKTKFYSTREGRTLLEEEIEEKKRKEEIFFAKAEISSLDLLDLGVGKLVREKGYILSKVEDLASITFEIETEEYLKFLSATESGYFAKLIDKKKNKMKITPIIAYQYDDLGMDVTVIFNHLIAPILLELKKWFTIYDLKVIAEFNNKYAILLYRFLKKQIGLIKGKKREQEEITIRVKYPQLITALGAMNYKRVADFNRHALKPAVKEINQKSDLEIIDVRKIRLGRGGKTVAVDFKIREKGQQSKDLNEEFIV